MADKGYPSLHGWLRERLGRAREAIWTFFARGLAVAVSGLAAYWAKQPLLFPSLGPTAYLFFEAPISRGASLHDALAGHLVAVAAGAPSLATFGLLHAPPVLLEGVTPARVGAASLYLVLTGAVLLLLRASHPLAGATVLIVGLGQLRRGAQQAAVVVAVLTVAGWAINRTLGNPVPVWSVGAGRKSEQEGEVGR